MGAYWMNNSVIRPYVHLKIELLFLLWLLLQRTWTIFDNRFLYTVFRYFLGTFRQNLKKHVVVPMRLFLDQRLAEAKAAGANDAELEEYSAATLHNFQAVIDKSIQKGYSEFSYIEKYAVLGRRPIVEWYWRVRWLCFLCSLFHNSAFMMNDPAALFNLVSECVLDFCERTYSLIFFIIIFGLN